MIRFIKFALLVILPLQAVWFAVGAAIVGIFEILSRKKPFLTLPFILMAILGLLGQWFSNEDFAPEYKPPDYVQIADEPKRNPIRPYLHELSGWNDVVGNRREAVYVSEGFWRVPRYNSTTNSEYKEFLTGRWFEVKEGKTYTQSFYLRHDGSEAHISITFFTNNGHHPVETHTQAVAQGVWRVWASYTTKEGEHMLRALDFINGGGDFTYFDVGWPQLEEGDSPTAVSIGPSGIMSLAWRWQYWAGPVVMGFLVLQAGLQFFRYFSPNSVSAALLLGMLFHSAFVMYQILGADITDRATGLALESNILGHSAVVMAALLWILGGNRYGGLAIALAIFLVWSSGSRTAFWALLLLGAAWAWGLSSRRWVALGLATGLGALVLSQPLLLGRLGQSLTLDANVQARLQFWNVAWQAFMENPLGGVGFGNFGMYFDFNLPSNPYELSPGHAHNLLFHLLAGGGFLTWLGFTLWLIAIFYVFVRARNFRILTLFAVVILLNIFDLTFFNAWVFYPFMLALAFAATTMHVPNHSVRMSR